MHIHIDYCYWNASIISAFFSGADWRRNPAVQYSRARHQQGMPQNISKHADFSDIFLRTLKYFPSMNITIVIVTFIWDCRTNISIISWDFLFSIYILQQFVVSKESKYTWKARIANFCCLKNINIIMWHPQGWSTLPPAPAAAPPEAGSGTLGSQHVPSQSYMKIQI